MLWQPSLSDEYTKAQPDALSERITARRSQFGDHVVILGHHYQTDDVLRHADFTGDSLKLSQAAAEKVASRGARYVVFCGVHFMAETADLLTPDDVSVILPDLSAGCSMADMADYDDAIEAWNLMNDSLRAQGWRGRIIPITYINSSAAIKAFVGNNGGAVCTSSNARLVFEWAMRGGDDAPAPSPEESVPAKRRRGSAKGPGTRASRATHAPADADDIKILFLPDQHLGRNTAAAYGLNVRTETCVYDPRRTRAGEPLGGATPEQLLKSRVILWAGHCSVHKLFRPEHCDEIIAANAGKHGLERTRILVHPECCKEVVDKSDLAGSTEFIIKTLRAAPPGSHWAVGTEVHLVSRIAREAAQRSVHVRILSDCQCLCTTMFRIDQPHLCWVLDNLAKDKIVNRISVTERARVPALKALERMLRLTAPTGANAPVAAAATVD